MVSMDNVTIADCIEMMNRKGQRAIINDGKILGFQTEEIPTETANPSGDK